MSSPFKFALAFDGIDDYVTIPEAPSLYSTEFTIGFWIKLNLYPAKYSRVISKTNSSSDGFTILFDSSPVRKIYAAIRADNQQEFNTAIFNKSLPTEQWRHYAYTYYAHKLTAFENATPLGQIKLQGRYEPNATNDLLFGRSSLGPSDFAAMVISDVVFYDKALSSSQITQLYNGKYPTKHLEGHWKLDEGAGNMVIDSSGNDNNGKIVGAQFVSNKS